MNGRLLLDIEFTDVWIPKVACRDGCLEVAHDGVSDFYTLKILKEYVAGRCSVYTVA